ncbi:MAG: stringent starvation protein B [Flavobacteriales bacterium]|jgi:stringent starvation protein B
MSMNSSKPYLLNALYQWIVDNNCTPHIVVKALAAGVSVPEQYIDKNGEIVLNISPSAVQTFNMDNTAVSFSARFGGVSQDIYVPTFAVLSIYAHENGRGMMFDAEDQPDPSPPEPENKSDAAPKRPSLRVVK